MKKFENLLIISDIDGTLIDDVWEISKENIDAINYFTENGGTFTYATGRQATVTKTMVHQLMPNAPIICFNGAAIYDYATESFLWSAPLVDNVTDVVKDIMENCPYTGVEINATDSIYLVRGAAGALDRYTRLVPFFKTESSVDHVSLPWFKVVFTMEEEYISQVRSFVQSRPYFNNFQFCQSASWLYELLPYKVNKGTALAQLKNLLDNKHKVIAVGDNENDIELIKAADVGFAVENGSPLLLSQCKNITVSQKNHVLADIVKKLDENRI